MAVVSGTAVPSGTHAEVAAGVGAVSQAAGEAVVEVDDNAAIEAAVEVGDAMVDDSTAESSMAHHQVCRNTDMGSAAAMQRMLASTCMG